MGKPDEKTDRDLAAMALAKRRRGERPNRRESAALRRLERAHEEESRWSCYHTIPQRHWRQMSGRQRKVFVEQAERYGIPFGERIVDLPKVVKALHDFLDQKAFVLDRGEGGDPLLDGPDSPALERYREEMYHLARLKRLQQEGFLLPRDRVHEVMARVASILRGAGDTLQKVSPEAHEILGRAFDQAQREIDATYSVPEEAAAPP